MQTRRKRKRRSGLQGADNADELMFRLTASSGDQESHRGLGLAVRCGEVVTNPGLTHPFSMHCIPLTEVSLHHQQERQMGWARGTTYTFRCLGCPSTRKQDYPVCIAFLVTQQKRILLPLSATAGDPGSIPGSGRSPGERNGNPLQYSCLENPMDSGVWKATVHGVAESDMA